MDKYLYYLFEVVMYCWISRKTIHVLEENSWISQNTQNYKEDHQVTILTKAFDILSCTALVAPDKNKEIWKYIWKQKKRPHFSRCSIRLLDEASQRCYLHQKKDFRGWQFLVKEFSHRHLNTRITNKSFQPSSK